MNVCRTQDEIGKGSCVGLGCQEEGEAVLRSLSGPEASEQAAPAGGGEGYGAWRRKRKGLRAGGGGGAQVQTSAILSLLCDTFLLGAHFPHPNSGGKQELIFVCLCPGGPSSRVPWGPVTLIRTVLRLNCSVGRSSTLLLVRLPPLGGACAPQGLSAHTDCFSFPATSSLRKGHGAPSCSDIIDRPQLRVWLFLGACLTSPQKASYATSRVPVGGNFRQRADWEHYVRNIGTSQELEAIALIILLIIAAINIFFKLTK